jgi:hypothetical protein
MAHGPRWYTSMGGLQSRPTGQRIQRADLGSLGDDTLSTPTVVDQFAISTAKWQQDVLNSLQRGADTLTLQRWLQIAATLSIPVAAAIWKALWPSLGKRFGVGTESI